MAQQTAMQMMIEWCTSLKDNEQQCTDWIVIKNKAIELLQMEKEQIIKAVDSGFDEGCKHPEDITLQNAEKYYNETYGQQ